MHRAKLLIIAALTACGASAPNVGRQENAARESPSKVVDGSGDAWLATDAPDVWVPSKRNLAEGQTDKPARFSRRGGEQCTLKKDPEPKPSCNGLDGLTGERGKLHDFILKYCEDRGDDTLDEGTGANAEIYGKSTRNEVRIAMEWSPDEDVQPNKADCKKHLLTILDGCDTNNSKYKGGGSRKIGRITYKVELLPTVYCEANYHFFSDQEEFTVLGRGFHTTGEEVAASMQSHDCHQHDIIDRFKNATDEIEPGWDWRVQGLVKSLDRGKSCIVDSMKDIEGCPSFSCSGNGLD